MISRVVPFFTHSKQNGESRCQHQQQSPAINPVYESSDNISTNVSIIGKEECDEIALDQMSRNNNIRLAEDEARLKVTIELNGLAELATRLRLRLSSPISLLNDPLFEVFKFLSRKQIAHCLQLTNCRFRAMVCGQEEHWPKFKFGRFVLFTDEDLKRTTKYWLFKNRIELKAPPEEMAPIMGWMDMKLGNIKKIVDPTCLVSHYSDTTENAQPKSVYLFINLDDKDSEDFNEDEENFEMMALRSNTKNQRVFIHLPNKLASKQAMAATIYWFRQLAKVHFVSVHFEQYRWTAGFLQFLADYGINKFLPMSADALKSYNPFSINLLRNTIQPGLCTLWDMHGTSELLKYLIGEQTTRNGNKRWPETIRIWGFIPQQIQNDLAYGGENSFFDALSHCARNSKQPEQIIHRIDLNFKQNPAQWPKIAVHGMQLIYKSQTFKVDEEDGTETETVEMRYRMRNANAVRKFRSASFGAPMQMGQPNSKYGWNANRIGWTNKCIHSHSFWMKKRRKVNDD